MCSCSGSCNCNSATIPRGPQGLPGPQGTAATVTVGNVSSLPAGSTPVVTNTGTNPSAAVFNFGIPAGTTGGQGIPGINAFTNLTEGFVQPDVNNNVTLNVLNTQWIAEDSILFVGPSLSTPTDAGGFYIVVSVLTSTSVEVKRLEWTIPNISFEATGQFVGGTDTLVMPSGTIGPENTNLAEIRNARPVVSAPAGSYDVILLITAANQICTSDGDLAKFIFVAQTFSTAPPAGPDKPYFEFEINSTVASLRTGTLSADEMVLDVTSIPSYATIEITLKRLSSTSAVCFIKAFLDNAGSSKGIVSYLGDTTVNPITIDFNNINNFKLTVTLPQTMSYSLLSSWIENYKS